MMDGELYRECPICKDKQIHRYKFIKDKVLFFCNNCGNLDIKDMPKEELEDNKESLK